MKLQIILDGQVLGESQLQPTLSLSDEDGVTDAMRKSLREALNKDILTPSQALRVKFRVVDASSEAEPWVAI